jgi:hypothetical protein
MTTENTTNQISTTSSLENGPTAEPKGLWSWGKIPVGHTLNGSGVLIETPSQDPFVEILPRGI